MAKEDLIYSQIKMQGYTWCKILIGNNPVIVFSSDATKTFTPDELVKAIKEYCNQMPGTYNIHLKKRNTDRNDNIIKFTNVSFGDYTSASTSELLSSNKSLADIEKEVEERILNKLINQKKENDLKEREERILMRERELETVGGKASFIAMHVLTELSKKFIPPTGKLAGTNPDNTMNNATSQQQYCNDAVPIEQRTEEDRLKTVEAINNILTVTSPSTLHALSVKFLQNPNLVNQLKAFANV